MDKIPARVLRSLVELMNKTILDIIINDASVESRLVDHSGESERTEDITDECKAEDLIAKVCLAGEDIIEEVTVELDVIPLPIRVWMC